MRTLIFSVVEFLEFDNNNFENAFRPAERFLEELYKRIPFRRGFPKRGWWTQSFASVQCTRLVYSDTGASSIISRFFLRHTRRFLHTKGISTSRRIAHFIFPKAEDDATDATPPGKKRSAVLSVKGKRKGNYYTPTAYYRLVKWTEEYNVLCWQTSI